MWKGCRVIGWVMVVLMVGGCQWTSSVGSRLGSWWRSKEDEEYRLLLKSIDEYARKNGLTRQQAIRQLREEADRYAMEQRQQGALYSQQRGSLPPTGYGPQQEQPAGSGVNQASWTQTAEPGSQSPTPVGKSLISAFR